MTEPPPIATATAVAAEELLSSSAPEAKIAAQTTIKLFEENAPKLSRRMNRRRGSLPTSVWRDSSVLNMALHHMTATPWQQVPHRHSQCTDTELSVNPILINNGTSCPDSQRTPKADSNPLHHSLRAHMSCVAHPYPLLSGQDERRYRPTTQSKEGSCGFPCLASSLA